VDRIHSNHRVEWFDPPLATPFGDQLGAPPPAAARRHELEVRRGFSHLNRARASRSLGVLISSSLSLSLSSSGCGDLCDCFKLDGWIVVQRRPARKKLSLLGDWHGELGLSGSGQVGHRKILNAVGLFGR